MINAINSSDHIKTLPMNSSNITSITWARNNYIIVRKHEKFYNMNSTLYDQHN